MLSAFTNSFKIPDLRNKLFYTLSLLFVARIGANIPIPGINPPPCSNSLPTKPLPEAAECSGSTTCLRVGRY